MDELHTAWTVSATWEELPARSGGGNQQPYYFAALKPVYETVTQWGVLPEVALRLPSMLAWLAILGVVTAFVHCRGWGVSAFSMAAGGLVLDQRQLFYGTEARVYMLQQLFVLLAWIALWGLSRRSLDEETSGALPGSSRGVPGARRLALGWAIACALVCSLHLASIPAVFCQCSLFVLLRWLAGVKATGDRRRRSIAFLSTSLLGRLSAAEAAAIVAIPSLAALVALTSDLWLWNADPWEASVWQRRGNWSGFAGGSSWADFLRAVPVHGYVLPAVVAAVSYQGLLGVSSVGRERRPSGSDDSSRDFMGAGRITRSTTGDVLFWLFAALAPALLVWFAAWLEVAPMLHQRYLLVCYAPMVLATAAIIARIPSSLVRSTTAGLVLVCLLCLQGTLPVWKQGSLVAWQRVEGWRQASRFVGEHFEDADRLWVASGLIEASGQTPPLDPRVDEYLSYPLRSIYQVNHGGVAVFPHALLNRVSRWPGQFRLTGADLHWVVLRGPPAKLESLLARVSQESGGVMEIKVPPRGFGSVSVAKIGLAATPP